MFNVSTQMPAWATTVLGSCVSGVMFVGAALLMPKSMEAAEGLMMLAGVVLGVVGIQVRQK